MGDQYHEVTNENSSGYSEETAATTADRQHSLTVADSVSAPAGRVAESAWRRVHWLTPLLQVWQALVIIVVVVLTQSLNNVIMLIKNLRENVPGHPGILLLVIAVPLAMLTLLIIYLYFAWRATSWIVTATDVQYRRGIFFKKHRKIPLDRVQSVDVYRPLAARIFGLGALRVESAGGQGSRVEIQFLANKYLDQARREVVARIAGRPLPSEHSPQQRGQGLAGTALFAEDDYHLAADEYEVYRVSPGRLIASVLLTSQTVWLLLMALIVAVGAIVLFIMADLTVQGIVAGSIIPTIISIGIIPLMILSYAWSRFNSGFNFSANITHDGIRVTSGLLALKSQTLPPGRIHAIRFLQPLLWRPFGWWQAEVTLAGHGVETSGDQKKQAADNLLLPVGTLEQAKIILDMAIRDLGINEGAESEKLLQTAFNGKNSDSVGSFISIGKKAKLLDPFARLRRAFAATDTVLIYRDGWLRRKVTFAPHERAQSVTTSAGPLQRHLGLAGVRLDLVPGTATMKVPHLDAQVEHGNKFFLLPKIRKGVAFSDLTPA
ncbi:MAG: PH domain-containing protein [Varibaculum cambriense]|uniref:PH domain-containing protein n=1 Tax=Varibaculum cambriense TaxID=184870 RepID=UPI0029144DA0|nr:PH domain-containing protein [Varibaculum cambriense]MDU4027951.1 PH domain-containing protein [Varibaculum cambriense]